MSVYLFLGGIRRKTIKLGEGKRLGQSREDKFRGREEGHRRSMGSELYSNMEVLNMSKVGSRWVIQGQSLLHSIETWWVESYTVNILNVSSRLPRSSKFK